MVTEWERDENDDDMYTMECDGCRETCDIVTNRNASSLLELLLHIDECVGNETQRRLDTEYSVWVRWSEGDLQYKLLCHLCEESFADTSYVRLERLNGGDLWELFPQVLKSDQPLV